MKKISLFIAAAFMLWTCNNSTNNNVASNTASSPSVTSNTTTDNNAAPTSTKIVAANQIVGEKSVKGTLIEALDMDYPRAFVTVQVGAEKISANFSEEDPNAYKVKDVQKMLKKNVTMLYSQGLMNSALAIQVAGKSIYAPENAAEILPEYKKITGLLNAAELTKGDLPGLMSVKTADGTIYEFEYFVTEIEAAQNGKTVDLYYTAVTNNKLISIEINK